MSEKQLVGKVSNFFTNISVALIEVSSELKVGDNLSFEGSTTNFEQPLESMQINREEVTEAGPGDHIGIKVKERVRTGDQVFKV